MRRVLPMLALLAGMLSPVAVLASSPGLAPLPVPEPGRAVYDTAGIWSPATIEDAERMLASLRADTGTQTAVVSLATGLDAVTEAQAIGDASLIMRRFGIGTEGRNDGLVVLFDLDTSLRHGQIRVYPGYDLEAAGLPADVARQIFEDDMQPLAADGDLDGALLGGLAGIDRTLREAAGLGTEPRSGSGNGPGGAPIPIWTPGADEPVVIDQPGGPGLPFAGDPLLDAGGAFGGFVVVAILLGVLGVALSAITGGGRGRVSGGDPGGIGAHSWWSWNNHNGPWSHGGGGSGVGGGDAGGGGFGGGGDAGGSGGGGGSF